MLQCPAEELLRFESKIGSSGRTCGDSHFLSLGASGFLPGRDGVISGRHVTDGVSAFSVASGVGSLHHDKPAVHPWMDVALHRDHFRSFPAFFYWPGSWWLRLIPRDIAGDRIRQRVNVVRGLIAGGHLEFLIHRKRQDVWGVHAVFLVEN